MHDWKMSGADEDADYNFITDELESYYEQVYTSLSVGDIQRLQDQDISTVSTVLAIAKDLSSILLQHYKWDVNHLMNKWFWDEEKARKAVEMQDFRAARKDAEVCGICFDPFDGSNKMHAVSCGHPYCGECWKAYIASSTTGQKCLMLRCPYPSCKAVVDRITFDLFASDQDKKKYAHFLVHSYTNRKIKWCPAPDCVYAVQFSLGTQNYEVYCKSGHRFCWNCREEVHSPVDCDTFRKWTMENSEESKNWILVNSKPCPNCKTAIEKIEGCMHMVCPPPCEYHFCWMCLGPWSDHPNRPGGFYACDIHTELEKLGSYQEHERNVGMAKSGLERYTKYYNHWQANHLSMQKALADLDTIGREKLEKLCNSQNQSYVQLNFITEAFLQIVECRQFLKWTCVYRYYLPEHEHQKQKHFEYLQGQAICQLELLYRCAKFDIAVYLEASAPLQHFDNFRIKLTNLTRVTRTYFANLARGLMRRLEDVELENHQDMCSKPSSSMSMGESSSGSGCKLSGERGSGLGFNWNGESSSGSGPEFDWSGERDSGSAFNWNGESSSGENDLG